MIGIPNTDNIRITLPHSLVIYICRQALFLGILRLHRHTIQQELSHNASVMLLHGLDSLSDANETLYTLNIVYKKPKLKLV